MRHHLRIRVQSFGLAVFADSYSACAIDIHLARYPMRFAFCGGQLPPDANIVNPGTYIVSLYSPVSARHVVTTL